jgi:hypothetical protein
MIGLAYLQKSDREALIHMVININEKNINISKNKCKK